MLGDATRLAILRCLMTDGGEMNVGQIVSSTGRELANVSKHLRQLADARLLSRSKKGAFVLYRLDDPVVEKICELVCESLRKEIDLELKAKRKMLKRARL
jgi:DNA-binding transcriptional ArsR family regulator